MSPGANALFAAARHR